MPEQTARLSPDNPFVFLQIPPIGVCRPSITEIATGLGKELFGPLFGQREADGERFGAILRALGKVERAADPKSRSPTSDLTDILENLAEPLADMGVRQFTLVSSVSEHLYGLQLRFTPAGATSNHQACLDRMADRLYGAMYEIPPLALAADALVCELEEIRNGSSGKD